MILLLVLVLFIQNDVDAFADFDTSTCGTAGYKPSEALYTMLGKFGDDIKKTRLYTKSECNKLDGGTFDGATCKNGSINYNEKCAFLNTTFQSPAPNECKVDGTVLGKPNIGFSATKGGKTTIIPNGAAQVYTKNECTLLKGEFIILEDFMKKEGYLPEEIAKAVHLNGETYGLCFGKDIIYTLMCTVDEPPSMTKDVSAAAKKHLTNWLK